MNLRACILLLHRYAGLTMAAFLVVIGLTGSIIVFNPELGHRLNPPPRVASAGRPLLDGIELRARAQALEPRATFNVASLHLVAGEGMSFSAEPRVDAVTGSPADLGFDTLWLDPYTGRELRRERATTDLWPVTRQNVLLLVNRLHSALAVPGNWGGWLLGGVAVLWTLDCVWSLYLTFPARRARTSTTARQRSWAARWWRPSWLVKWRGPALRLNLDLHRAGGLWLWPLLFVFAWTGVGFNLGPQVYAPVMRAVFGMPDAFGQLAPSLPQPQPDPALDWKQARALARTHMAQAAAQQGFHVEHEYALFYQPDKGEYLYLVRSDRDPWREFGVTALRMTGAGRLVSVSAPTGASLGRTLDTWMFALHMGYVGGLPYRLCVALMGLVVSGFSVTGVYLWWKKRLPRRRARRARSHGRSPAGRSAMPGAVLDCYPRPEESRP